MERPARAHARASWGLTKVLTHAPRSCGKIPTRLAFGGKSFALRALLVARRTADRVPCRHLSMHRSPKRAPGERRGPRVRASRPVASPVFTQMTAVLPARGQAYFGWLARYARHLRRCASAMRIRPASVFGPVDSPPCRRQRFLFNSTLMRHAPPALVLAPHLGRSRRRGLKGNWFIRTSSCLSTRQGEQLSTSAG